MRIPGLLLLLLVVCGPYAWAGYLRMGLAEAIKKNAVRVTAINVKGAYQGKTTTVRLTSNDAVNTLQIKIDIGTILTPDSNKYQPMILAAEETLEISPMKSGEVLVETFCGNHSKYCPAVAHGYRYKGVASDTLVTVLKFVKQHALLNELGQNAVWATTDEGHMSGVYDRQQEALSGELLQLICKVTGRKMPEYKTVNAPLEQVPDVPAYVPKPLQIIASFRLILEDTKTLTLGVYNEQGEMIQSVFERKEFPRSGHEFDVTFEAADVPAGYYYIRLSEGYTVLQEKKVRVQ